MLVSMFKARSPGCFKAEGDSNDLDAGIQGGIGWKSTPEIKPRRVSSQWRRSSTMVGEKKDDWMLGNEVEIGIDPFMKANSPDTPSFFSKSARESSVFDGGQSFLCFD